MVIVANENGIDINCDESGKFSATAYGQRIEDRSLSKVKKWTAQVKPTVTLLEIDQANSYARARGFLLHDNVAEVLVDAKGAIYGRGPTNPSNTQRRYTFQPTFRNLYEPNEAAQKRIRSLNENRRAWEKELEERYNAAYDEIVSTLTPITTERFAELMKAKIAEKGDGKS